MKELVLGADPGLKGAFVLTDGEKFVETVLMPVRKEGGGQRIPFGEIFEVLEKFRAHGWIVSSFIERAVSFGMGTKAAFNYGRGFEALLIAFERHRLPYHLVEPSKWTREMHQGVSKDLQPKVRSLTAVKRHFPFLVSQLPVNRKGNFLDGPVDALLLAGYGLRYVSGTLGEDFF